MKTFKNRPGLVLAAFAFAALCAGPALAHGHGHGHGHGPDHGARFKRADKNGDGFLTKDEVGERRWEKIKVADSNADKKVSRDELKQAFKDGKLKRKGRGGDKAKKS